MPYDFGCVSIEDGNTDTFGFGRDYLAWKPEDGYKSRLGVNYMKDMR